MENPVQLLFQCLHCYVPQKLMFLSSLEKSPELIMLMLLTLAC